MSQLAPPPLPPPGKRCGKEELSELQKGAAAARSLKEGVRWGKKRRSGRKGKGRVQEEGDESARPKRARVFGTRLHPNSSRRRGRGRAAFRALRLEERARKGDEEATSSPRPSLAAQEGSVGAAVPSPIGEWRQRPLAPSEGADCGALRAFLSLAFTPPPPGKASGMTPTRLRTVARVT